VLRARRDLPALEAARPRGDVARDERGVVAEGARPDHRVRGHVDVGDRREVPVDAGSGELGADRRSDSFGDFDIVDDTEHLAAREAREDAGRGEPLELAHPRTAPAVRPNAMRRWTSRKKTTTGIAVSDEAAISAPQSVCRLEPRKYESHTVTVCLP